MVLHTSKLFLFNCCQDNRRVAVRCSYRLLSCRCCHSVWIIFKVCKIKFAQRKTKRTCTIILGYFILIYSAALQVISPFIYYRLWMAMVTDALGMKMQSLFLFFCLYLTFFCLINLKINFYCIWLYLYIYIFTKNIYININCHCIKIVFNIYYCEHGIYTLLHPLFFHFGTKVNVSRTTGWKQDAEFLMDCFTI